MAVSAGHDPAMPESASPQLQCTVTSSAYQPAPFGAVVGAPLMLGGVLSMLIGPTLVDAPLPAASAAVPLTDWCAPSPSSAGLAQPTMPDSASSQANVTFTTSRYQSAAFGARSGAPAIVGGVLSTFRVAESLAVLPALNVRSEEHTSELQSHSDLVCRLLLEKKKSFHLSRNHFPIYFHIFFLFIYLYDFFFFIS